MTLRTCGPGVEAPGLVQCRSLSARAPLRVARLFQSGGLRSPRIPGGHRPGARVCDHDNQQGDPLSRSDSGLALPAGGGSVAVIADYVYDLIPPGELVFAFSFSSTVVSALLNARSKGKFFRVICTESRPAMEGRKLATMLSSGGIEVINTFDTALGLVLSECRTAFMGCDVVGNPGVVNKVGSWTLAVACRELGIPLYALAGTEKFATDERLFEFEKHERPAEEVWSEIPKGVRVLNHQFELVPFSLITGLVTEKGILQEKDINKFVSSATVHPALALELT